jgi:hypothetical protein
MSSYLENLALDLFTEIMTRILDQKIKLPCEVNLVDSEDELLSIFKMNLDATCTVLSEDNPKLLTPAFPVTIFVKDQLGGHFEMTWASPMVH